METMPTVWKKVGSSLYVHRTAVERISSGNMTNLSRADEIIGHHDFDWNVVRISRENVAFLLYEKFDEEAFPQLLKSTLIDLVRGRARETDYSNHSNRPILHRKELFVAEDYPNRSAFARLTQKLEQLDLFYDSQRIGYQNQWAERLKKHGVKINGHDVTSLKEATKNDVDRHKTALVRYQLSQPVKLLLRHNLMKNGNTFFDYGCGRGDDLNGLSQGGFDARGWDPHFSPDEALIKSDIVNLGFVLNVIEAPQERSKALVKAWSLTKKVLSIAVMTPSSEAIENSKPYGDGFLTSRGTFQKYFMQEQLKEYVKQTLDENPIAIAPGIFFVFQDKLAEQEFLLERYNRHRYKAVTIRPDRPKPTISAKPFKANILRPQLEQLWQVILDHGRYVTSEETPDEIMNAFRAENVSLKRAEQYCRDKLIDPNVLEKAAADRREDLLVYFALEKFSGRKSYRQLPKSLQNDVRSFLDSYANGQIEALNLLYSTGNKAEIQKACQEFSNLGLGYILDGDQMLLHASVMDQLPPVLRCYIGCAGVLYGDTSNTDLIKIHMGSGKLTLQIYDDFSKSLPILTQRIKIDMRQQSVRVFDYDKEDTQILYMKSLYIPKDFEGFDAQSKFDRSLQKLELFDFSDYGPRADFFEATLQEHGLFISGFELNSRVTH